MCGSDKWKYKITQNKNNPKLINNHKQKQILTHPYPPLIDDILLILDVNLESSSRDLIGDN